MPARCRPTALPTPLPQSSTPLALAFPAADSDDVETNIQTLVKQYQASNIASHVRDHVKVRGYCSRAVPVLASYAVVLVHGEGA